MKILLVTPISRMSYQIIPDLGLMYLAGAARRAGHQVEILDCRRDGLSWSEFGAALAASRPDLVGIKSYSNEAPRVAKMARIVRRTLPRAAIVIGGPHPSMDPAAALGQFEAADYVMAGEAELGFPLLLDRLEHGGDPGDVPGLGWREAGGSRFNPPRLADDLDSLPWPAWDLMPPNRYPDEAAGMFVAAFPAAPMMLSRGCPFSCGYCGGRYVMGQRLRYRSVENILAEIELLERDFGVRTFTFVDDNFTMNRAAAVSLFTALAGRARKIAFTFPNGIRAGTLDEELVRLMERAGCRYLALGIESGSDETLARMNKRQTVAEVREKVALIRRVSSIKVVGFFILGYPGETLADVKQTIRFASELPLHHPHFCVFNPLPGTPIYQELMKQGVIGPEGLALDRLTFDHLPVILPGLPPEKVQRLHQYAYARFYLKPWRLWNLMQDLRSQGHFWGIMRRAINLFR